MIKFFRKIRMRLLSENKLGRYLIYAIGEIVLVVIGILIALQINNWNENQKIKAEEAKLLQTFKSTLHEDLSSIAWFVEEYITIDNSINILLETFEKDLTYHDSLNFHFLNSTASWIPKLEQEVFATMTASDLSIISNDSLRGEIVKYYSFAKRKFDPTISRYIDVISHASKDVYNTRFDGIWNTRDRAMIPHDFEALKTDDEYQYFLKSQSTQLWYLVRSPLKEAKSLSEALLAHIEQELERLEE